MMSPLHASASSALVSKFQPFSALLACTGPSVAGSRLNHPCAVHMICLQLDMIRSLALAIPLPWHFLSTHSALLSPSKHQKLLEVKAGS